MCKNLDLFILCLFVTVRSRAGKKMPFQYIFLSYFHNLASCENSQSFPINCIRASWRFCCVFRKWWRHCQINAEDLKSCIYIDFYQYCVKSLLFSSFYLVLFFSFVLIVFQSHSCVFYLFIWWPTIYFLTYLFYLSINVFQVFSLYLIYCIYFLFI